MREYIPKDEVLDIIGSMPTDLIGEYVYELDGIWLEDDSGVKSHCKVHGNDSNLISREDAIELLTKIVFDEPPYLDSETLCRMYAEEQINTLPSADRPPYRIDPDGTAWVNAHDGQDLDKVGRVILDYFPYAKIFYPDGFPNCGAKMGG